MGSNDDGSGGEGLQLGQGGSIAKELHHVETREIFLESLSDLTRNKKAARRVERFNEELVGSPQHFELTHQR